MDGKSLISTGLIKEYNMRTTYLASLLLLVSNLPVMATTSNQPLTHNSNQHTHDSNSELTVYKSKSCGCCKEWVTHMNKNGFNTTAIDVVDMGTIKNNYQIKPNQRSCHTAVSADGFIFEGHVPAKFVKQFLSEQHPEGTIGLSVPAMPVGTPGMEMGKVFHKYNINLLTIDSPAVSYQYIEQYAEQF